MIGRFLCRIGLHRWGYGNATDVAETGPELHCYAVVTYAWCKRKRCSQPLTIVDVEHRTWIR